MIEANILPAALYGIEMTNGCRSALERLQAAIAGVIGTRSAKRSQLGSYKIQKWKRDLDPDVVQLVRRITLVRRQIDKNPEVGDVIKLIIRKYAEGHVRYDLGVREIREEFEKIGPVGFLIDNLKKHGASIDDNLILSHDGEQDIDIRDYPWQALKEEIQNIGKKARVANTAKAREAYDGLEEVDSLALQAALKRRSQEEINVISNHGSLANWTAEKLKEAGKKDDEFCQLCSKKETSVEHMQWECQKVRERRKKTYLCSLDHNDVPKHLLMGLPGSMDKNIHTTFWGKQRSEVETKDAFVRCKMGLPKDNKEWVRKD